MLCNLLFTAAICPSSASMRLKSGGFTHHAPFWISVHRHLVWVKATMLPEASAPFARRLLLVYATDFHSAARILPVRGAPNDLLTQAPGISLTLMQTHDCLHSRMLPS
jgi:hypothetical protein